MGNGTTLTIIGVMVALLLLLRRERTLALGWIITLFGSGILNLVLKASFHRVRPEYATIGGWSFPSGHAMGSFVAYGMVAYLAAVFLPRRPAQLVAGLLLLLVLLIGFSRIYLGVHYFSDVVAGYSAAVVWLAVCISGLEVARLRGRRAATFAAPSRNLAAACRPLNPRSRRCCETILLKMANRTQRPIKLPPAAS